MPAPTVKKLINTVLVLALLWVGVRYALPVAMPFLLGAALALAAEPVVSLCSRKIPRPWAAGVGVSLSIALLAGLLAVLGGAAVHRLGTAASRMPDMAGKLRELEDLLLTAADSTPESIRPLAQRTVLQAFDSSEAVITQLTARLPGLLTKFAGSVGNSVLGIGTGLLSAFLISARLPRLKAYLTGKMPPVWQEKILPAVRRFSKALLGWVKAQGKLALVTWGILTAGFFLLGISHAPLVGGLIALVDAIPILGTGTVLVPWAAVCFLQQQTARGLWLLCLYAAAFLTRTVLEPRLVGKQLGLDPLMTLIALYAGYRLWGIGGLLLMPILASAMKSVLVSGE